MQVSRRHFLKRASAVSLGFAGLYRFLDAPLSAAEIPFGYGDLVTDPEGVFDLPEGFSYQIISRFGDTMDDGLRVPSLHDGMAAFPGPDGRTILVRNHEISPSTGKKLGPFGDNQELFSRVDPAKVYDAGRNDVPCLGGTTTLVYNTQTQELERHFLSLTGTIRNCAGGPTPWNTWISCEETVITAYRPPKPGEPYYDYKPDKDHGYPFEVPATDQIGLVDPVPLREMGRFYREAIAVDPQSGVVYQTEDRPEGALYRFIPNKPGQLVAGGRLQALVALDRKQLDTRNWQAARVRIGESFPVTWVDMEDVESPQDNLRLQAFSKGAALFARGEGMWYGNHVVYFVCTTGGKSQRGQIWKYTPSPVEGTSEEAHAPGVLSLFAEPDDASILDRADNITVAPWGDVIICEDGAGKDYLVGITPEGKVYKLARNALSSTELAGGTFSPDGSTFFVNIQGKGLTLAVTGPWRNV
ncbi:MAG: DUF839 domain-containing protein [bacterium]|nr:DUF839 domain-containing protein [bacterium]